MKSSGGHAGPGWADGADPDRSTISPTTVPSLRLNGGARRPAALGLLLFVRREECIVPKMLCDRPGARRRKTLRTSGAEPLRVSRFCRGERANVGQDANIAGLGRPATDQVASLRVCRPVASTENHQAPLTVLPVPAQTPSAEGQRPAGRPGVLRAGGSLHELPGIGVRVPQPSAPADGTPALGGLAGPMRTVADRERPRRLLPKVPSSGEAALGQGDRRASVVSGAGHRGSGCGR